jgi:hypothetical protein
MGKTTNPTCANPACGCSFRRRTSTSRYCSRACFLAVGRRPEPPGPRRKAPADARPDRLALLAGPTTDHTGGPAA